MENEVKMALEQVPQFRERSKRGHFIFIMTMRKLGVIPKEQKVKSGDVISFIIGTPSAGSVTNEFLSTADSYDRYWRKILEENESLRGSDYDTKGTYETAKKEELGYCVPSLKESEEYFNMGK